MDPTRSAVMARIRGQNTKPEMLLRKALWAAGHRYRVNYKKLVGRPDIVFPGRRLAVFVDGCFWHGCPEHYVRPRTRTEFWDDKLRSTVKRDRRQTLQLEQGDWRVVRIWEHEVFLDLPNVAKAIGASFAAPEETDDPDWRVVAVEPGVGNLERRFLESLRQPDVARTVERVRSTSKW